MQEERQKLNSWKEIASYLKCDESTARRWERKNGLPVYRVGGMRGSSVYAYVAELEGWLRGELSFFAQDTPVTLITERAMPFNSVREPQAEIISGNSASGGTRQPGPVAILRKIHAKKYALAAILVFFGIVIAILWASGVRISKRPLSKPIVTSIDPGTPIRRNLDQTVTVHGQDFQDGLTITVFYPGGIGRLSGTQLQDVETRSLEMVVLLGKTGEYAIVVNNPDGTHSNKFSFQVTGSK